MAKFKELRMVGFLFYFVSLLFYGPLLITLVDDSDDFLNVETWPTISSTICGGVSQLFFIAVAYGCAFTSFACRELVVKMIQNFEQAPNDCNYAIRTIFASKVKFLKLLFKMLYAGFSVGVIGVGSVATTQGNACNEASHDKLHLAMAILAFVSILIFFSLFWMVFDFTKLQNDSILWHK